MQTAKIVMGKLSEQKGRGESFMSMVAKRVKFEFKITPTNIQMIKLPIVRMVIWMLYGGGYKTIFTEVQ